MTKFTHNNKMLEYDLNKSYSNIFCFSTTRHGGRSAGNYASFNCNPFCGDNITDVEQNCNLLSSLLPVKPNNLVIPHQTHGIRVRNIDIHFTQSEQSVQSALLEGIDALITNLPQQCLCISTADCIPVLCYDTHHHAIAAIHAGWRGTVQRIVENTLEEMKRAFGTEGKDIVACIGPGISLNSFEVGDEVYQAFNEAHFPMSKISQHHHKWHIDLWEANRLQLIEFGVKSQHIELSRICTFQQNEDFFSARRQGIASGRILSGIILR